MCGQPAMSCKHHLPVESCPRRSNLSPPPPGQLKSKSKARYPIIHWLVKSAQEVTGKLRFPPASGRIVLPIRRFKREPPDRPTRAGLHNKRQATITAMARFNGFAIVVQSITWPIRSQWIELIRDLMQLMESTLAAVCCVIATQIPLPSEGACWRKRAIAGIFNWL